MKTRVIWNCLREAVKTRNTNFLRLAWWHVTHG